METRFLLPNKLKLLGWILLIPSAILGALTIFFEVELKLLEFKVFTIYSGSDFPWGGGSVVFGFDKVNLTKTIVGILFLLGAVMVAFAKEKHEDEFISKIRLESLVWATYISYAILFLCFLFIYGTGFLYVMIFNMFTILILFIIRFNYVIYRTSKSLQNEKQSKG
jgi:small-conductance mechanosensitive channel